MFTKAFIVKGKNKREIPANVAIELMRRYTVIGFAYNRGQILYLPSVYGKRVHALLLTDRE